MRWRNHLCLLQEIGVAFSECAFVALVIQLAMCIAILSSVACSALPFSYFSTLAHKRYDFRQKKKKKVLNKNLFQFSVILLSATFLSLRSAERGSIVNVRRYSCKVPVILFSF